MKIGNKENILIQIVDDDPDDRLLVKEVFAEFHMEKNIRFAENGIKFLSYLANCDRSNDPETQIPDLVLLDLNMPQVDGFDVLHELKQNKDWSKIPVVILTTSSSIDDISRSYQMGAVGFITKPVSLVDFHKKMQGLIHYWFEIVSLPSK